MGADVQKRPVLGEMRFDEAQDAWLVDASEERLSLNVVGEIELHPEPAVKARDSLPVGSLGEHRPIQKACKPPAARSRRNAGDQPGGNAQQAERRISDRPARWHRA